MSDYLFEVVDKTGRKIRLTKERWSHITHPSSLHSYMTNYLEDVEQVLIKPDRISDSVYDINKANYYKYYKNRKQYLRVIVRYLNGDGFVISAYFVKNISI